MWKWKNATKMKENYWNECRRQLLIIVNIWQSTNIYIGKLLLLGYVIVQSLRKEHFKDQT